MANVSSRHTLQSLAAEVRMSPRRLSRYFARETNVIDHFAGGIPNKPLTTDGNVKADVLGLKDANHKIKGLSSVQLSLILHGRTDHLL